MWGFAVKQYGVRCAEVPRLPVASSQGAHRDSRRGRHRKKFSPASSALYATKGGCCGGGAKARRLLTTAPLEK